MYSKAEIMQRLAAVPTSEILRFLSDEAIFQVASRYFQALDAFQEPMGTQNPPFPESPLSSSVSDNTKPAAADRAKRPLNAFMAFRSYYIRIFPDVQQKTASGFLTRLWNKDLSRNKWTLIAKVYSFIRDEIGREKIALSYFLSLACPIMKLIEPSVYLETFGWSVYEDENGTPKLAQDENGPNITDMISGVGDCPSTESELLSAVLNVGYLSDQTNHLMAKLSACTNGIMTTGTSSLSVPYTPEKLDFIKVIQSDPIQATKELFGEQFDEQTIRSLGINSHNVSNVSSIDHLPMQVPYPDPRRYYRYATPHSHLSQPDATILRLNDLSDGQTFDLDSPWDVDAILGHPQQEGERIPESQRVHQFNARNDFHFQF